MSDKIKKDFSKEKEVIREILKNANFTEFTFHTGFELKFSRENDAELYGKPLPIEVKITILSDWWFGARDEWNSKVEQLTNGLDLVEPEEPVLSYELTCLRWSDEASVDEVDFEDDNMKIIFKCGKSISISYYNEMDYSWVISEFTTNDLNKGWNIICEDGEFFVSIPE
ncbi:hypothetical protein [Clostridium folliculivorans]|uniref:Uncharacterized protein n=1 Tax=Clostridium folliculivorans TaxID=2886038 RepID=A0A9W5Y6K7_9CLOT|nr:hypothetical protein [Clostridium folliculivorans]GKU27681.1 hypothetical protein CFOLD11_45080 [Clostridium folliculivorans]GKU32441.1 hypothetical protein CFB3_45490 [Clostridium folliculivorans]